MQSGIGPRDGLQSQNIPVLLDLPVGQRLNDRVEVPIYVKIKARAMQGMRSEINDINQFMTFLEEGKGMLANTSVIGSALLKSGFVRTPDLQIELSPTGMMGPHEFMVKNNYRDEILEQIDIKGDSLQRLGGLKFTVTLLRPFSVGTMWLWRQPDDTFIPRMNPSYLTDPRDQDSLVDGIQQIEQLIQNPYFQAIEAEILYPSFPECPAPVQPVGKKYWNCYVRQLATSGNHLTGTVLLGRVVDDRLRVKGIAGVRVVDQSILPETASGGMASTVLAVANRAYRIIRNDNRLRC